MEVIETYSRWRDYRNFIIIVVDAKGRGSVQFSIEDDKPEIGHVHSLFVLPEHRRQGLAKQLLSLAERRIKENGCTSATLEWHKDSSEDFVLDWYIRSGYSETEFDHRGALLKKDLCHGNKT